MRTRILISMFILSCFSVVLAQNRKTKVIKVRGVVVDASGFPIQKGYVFADSLKTGYRTNKKGEYKLRIPVETKDISIFSEKYGIQSVAYTGQEEVDFVFSKDKEVITEQELSELGYIFDIEIFRNFDKKDYSEYNDIFQIIREKFTGVTVNGTSIIVRGIIGGKQTPVFIVDGNYVPSIAGINPAELKSIELLKDEAAALYGSRGAPGVFIIKLKSH